MSLREELIARLQLVPPYNPESFANMDLGQRIRELLLTPEVTGVTSLQLRSISDTFVLENAISSRANNWHEIIRAIFACLPAGENVRSVFNEEWREALEIGQAYAATNTYSLNNVRIAEVAAAGTRMQAKGYQISVQDDCYVFAVGELERAAEEIRAKLAELGPGRSLGNIFGCLDRVYGRDYGMYLISRRYATAGSSRRPYYPFAFILNICVGSLFPKHPSSEPAKIWTEAIDLARDVVACLNIEPYHNLTYYMGIDPQNILKYLREIALYDHLFTLRQWRFSFTGEFIDAFFDDEALDVLQDRVGWSISDVLNLWRATTHFATSDPNLIDLPALQRGGIQRDKLIAMIDYFAHAQGSANYGYNSPFTASTTYNLPFKPFIRHGPSHLLLPAASLMGPAFFEATMSVVRPIIGSKAVSDLVGAGTERVAKAIFDKAQMNITYAAAKYSKKSDDEGECDFVLESNNTILFVECKAKPLTRASMSGVESEALLDFAGGMFAAQKQALRHERILRENGNIEFDDGSELSLNGRKIYRLAVTLIELGALQDRMLFQSLFEALSRSEVRATSEHAKAKKINELNEELSELRGEVRKMIDVGVEPAEMTRYSASFSLGQLEACIGDYAGDLDAFCRAIAIPMTYGALNSLAELHHFRNLEGTTESGRSAGGDATQS